MDNLRLEPVSAHAAAGGHHLLSFAVPSSIEFSSKSTINGVSQHCNSSLPPSLASLWTESQCVQNPNELLKAGMQSPDRGVEGTRSWDMSVNSVLQPKLGRPVSIAPVFAQTNVSVGSSMEALRANGPTLHLNHGSSPSASSFEHFSEAMDASGTDNSDNLHMCSPFTLLRENNAPISSDFRKDNAHTLPGFLASMEKVSSLPDAVVSALQPVPFSTKTETMTPQSQSFMSFTWDDKDGSKVRKEWISAVKEEVTVGGSVAMMAGLKTEQSNHALAGEVKELTMKREEEGVTIASLEDGSIGLRLGKRTYYGEVGGAEEFRGRVSNSRTFAGSCKDGIIKSSVNVSCAATADTTAPAAISATAAGTVSAAAITISTTTNNMSSSVGNNTGSSSSNTALVATVSSTLACSTSPATISVGNNGNHLPSTNNNNTKISSGGITSTSNNNTKISSGGITNKKQKGSSASITVPSCQAEGCTADLSEAKEYHRRHKVCEWHSKASRAKVNNLEQRFCQQCSRFHVLSAFDEGKRSCRRRLAGHNERRRKPPPEPMPFLSPAGFTYFADGRVNAALHEHPYFLQHRPASLVSVDNSVLASQLGLAGFPQREALSNYHALEFHRFMRGLSPMVGSGVGVLDGTGALMAANGSALALSSVLSSQTTPSSSSSVSLLPHVSSEMAISGRALSLLSSSLGSPETMSISLGMTSPSIDQYLPDNHPLSSSSRHQAPVDSTSCFNSAMGMPSSALHGLQRNHINSLNSITSSSSGCSVEMDQGRPPSISSFEGRSLILTKADGAFQNLQDGVNCNQGRPVLDLMHISPAESHHHQQQQQQQQQHSQAELSYAYLQGFSIFNKENVI